MMDNQVQAQLRSFFEANYPEFAQRFTAATNHVESLQIYEELKAHVRAQYQAATTSNDDPEGTAIYSLTPEQYQDLVTATGSEISQQIQAIVNTLSLVQQMKDAEQISAQMMSAGMYVFAPAAAAVFQNALALGMAILDAGVEAIVAVGVTSVVGLVVAVVVLALVPILYFMFKPAYTFTMLMNETDKDLKWGGDYEVHGKLTGFIKSIPKVSVFASGKKIVSAGFISGSKNDMALVGCQMGFTFTYDANTSFAYGVESPLTAIYVDNNCYCEINATAESVAKTTDSKNTQSSTSTSGAFSASIKCASKSGSGAWCLARAMKS